MRCGAVWPVVEHEDVASVALSAPGAPMKCGEMVGASIRDCAPGHVTVSAVVGACVFVDFCDWQRHIDPSRRVHLYIHNSLDNRYVLMSSTNSSLFSLYNR